MALAIREAILFSSVSVRVRPWLTLPLTSIQYPVSKMLLVETHPEGITFKVYVQPRSSKNTIVGRHEDTLKIKIKAPPVGGAANKMCIGFLATTLGVSKSSLEILSGHTGRTKRVLLRYPDENTAKTERPRYRDLVESLFAPQKTA